MAPRQIKKQVSYSDDEDSDVSEYSESDKIENEEDDIEDDDDVDDDIEDDVEDDIEDDIEDDDEDDEEIDVDEVENEGDVEEEAMEDDVIEEIEEEIADGFENDAEDDDSLAVVHEEAVKPTKKKTLKINFNEVPSTYRAYSFNQEEELREKTVKQLFELLNSQKNAETFEKYIFQTTVENHSEGTEIPARHRFKYVETVRNLFDYLLTIKETHKLKLSDILEVVKTNKMNYDSFFYEPYKEEIRKELKKSQIPVDVIEGIFTCPMCNLKYTQHYSVQTRRADEPPTVFIHCLNKDCKHKWRKG